MGKFYSVNINMIEMRISCCCMGMVFGVFKFPICSPSQVKDIDPRK